MIHYFFPLVVYHPTLFCVVVVAVKASSYAFPPQSGSDLLLREPTHKSTRLLLIFIHHNPHGATAADSLYLSLYLSAADGFIILILC